MLLALSFALLTAIDAGFLKARTSHIIWTTLASIAAIVLAGIMFTYRLQDYGISIVASAGGSSAYSETVPLNDFALTSTFAADNGDVSGLLIFSGAHFCQYYLHGLMEYFRLIEEFDGNAHALGRYTFFLTAKMVGMVAGISPIEYNPRGGVFTTFFGPTYVDFGAFSFMFTLLFGSVCQYLWRLSRHGVIPAKPLYFVLAIAIFFMPVVDMTSSSVSSYLMASAIAFAVLYYAMARFSTRYVER
jgi:hypothetical protein